MALSERFRIDKWLWAVRIFKTRTIAAEACKKGRIIVNGAEAKPSREIKPGEIIFVRKLPVVYTVRVKALTHNRLPAQRVPEFMEDLTSPEELEKLKLDDSAFFKRDKGAGRPTKKERRLLDDIINQ
ncbi:MAG TPA: RNA-binding S4 domain-containing protein [Bacteroidales bacterium]|nr:RNA-binding S4 domain-containing protein [Bacteroidales bacterium]